MIDNAQALPLYHQVAGVLRQRIEDGIYPVGGKLLSEDELAAEFEVSRATIRQAVGRTLEWFDRNPWVFEDRRAA